MAKKARIKVPKNIQRGEVFQVKTLYPHVMETGFRKDKKTGEPIPRNIVNRFECKYDGKVVFSADLHPAVSANPYMSFFVRAQESGELEFTWTEDGGAVTTKTRTITVT